MAGKVAASRFLLVVMPIYQRDVSSLSTWCWQFINVMLAVYQRDVDDLSTW